MTCIIGLADQKQRKTYIGGDSLSSDGHLAHIRSEEKVFSLGCYLFGFASSWRMGNILRYCFWPPEHPPEMPAMAYMVQRFIPAVQNALIAHGWMARENGDQRKGGDFLVGYAGEIFSIHDDFQVGMNADGIAAIGAGANFALGAVHVLSKLKPRDRIRRGLEAATHFSPFVRPPFVIKEMWHNIPVAAPSR